MAVERSFRDIPEGKLDEADQQSFLVQLGWSNAPGWDEVLRSKRVLLISEAGAGKTHECRDRRDRLWNAGEPAFFLELATLANSDVRTMLDPEEEARLDAWLLSQSDVATFFLDSYDELKLSLGSFEQALKRLSRSITGQLRRARIVITTRPIPFDGQLVRRLLPVPSLPVTEASGDSFAQTALHGRDSRRKPEDEDTPVEWRTVALMPLSDEQIAEFARGRDVTDPENLLEDLRKRNATEFARRPQDLIELCADWRDFKRIRTHREQVASNVRVKLKAREDRAEPAQLSVDKAVDGASRLALAMMATRRFSIRHSAETDIANEDVALDPSIILSDWPAAERQALLERALFGFASYGRVRFHHRSVMEYLAADRIRALQARGMTQRALERLLFAEAKGQTIALPSKRPIAGWLALSNNTVFETLRDHDPGVLFTEGDPESLTLAQRTQALRAFVKRYGIGGWRGLSVPHIQIHRFASPELAPEITQLWSEGIENPEIKELLLNLIELGRIADCADIAYKAATNLSGFRNERLSALDALMAVNDPRLEALTLDLAKNPSAWPDDLARSAVLRLFPDHLSVARLCKVLARVRERPRSIGDLSWQLPRLIANDALNQSTLRDLRDGLMELASNGLRWQGDWPHITSDYTHLTTALAATCVGGLQLEITSEWLRASALALRLPKPQNSSNESFGQLERILRTLNAEQHETLFWADDAIVRSVHEFEDAWGRYAQVAIHGATRMESVRDLPWIKRALADTSRLPEDRAMLLEAAMRLPPDEDWRKHIRDLKSLVDDAPEFLAAIEKRLAPSADDKVHRRWQVEDAKRKRQHERREAKNHASWVLFWREIANDPDTVFSDKRRGNTTWDLWRAMGQAGDDSRESGWNRRFIETHFGKEIADRLRLALMQRWRDDQPTLSSERADDEKNRFLVRWQLGLAAIYAEAEDPDWASKLTEDEAALAARYAPIELNGLPLWMEALIAAHPAAVDRTLGNELTSELESVAGVQWHSMLLQSVGHAPDPVIAAFLPRLRVWLDNHGDQFGHNESPEGAALRLERVVRLLMKHGDAATLTDLRDLAAQRLQSALPAPFLHVWLPTLMRLDASAGLAALERQIAHIVPAANTEAVRLFGSLFGDRHDGLSATGLGFTPSLLLRLSRLSYRHVRPADDLVHEDVYSPGPRDHAERGRNEILGALFKAGGEEGWAAKLEMAADPAYAHFKDRILAVADEHRAEELDAAAMIDAQAIALDATGEAPPSTSAGMFALMVDRLDDLDDLLLRDDSPRAAWTLIDDEKVMRQQIARELRIAANGSYTVDQEAVTADEKETDIRLRSTTADQEAVIELKVGEKDRSAADLRAGIMDQLVTKYMAPDGRRAGCFLITTRGDRRWDHPDTGAKLDLDGLITMLNEEALRIEQQMGGSLRIVARGLNLRPRLPTEREAKAKSNTGRSRKKT